MQNLPQAPNKSLNLAKIAYIHGEKKIARYWASLAASEDPNLEEAWLILAAVANPKASVGFLNHYLIINPKSQRAQRGLIWAVKRLESVDPNEALRRTPDIVQPLIQSATGSQDLAHRANFQIPKPVFGILLLLISFFLILPFFTGVNINFQSAPKLPNTSSPRRELPKSTVKTYETNHNMVMPSFTPTKSIIVTATFVPPTETQIPTPNSSPTILPSDTPANGQTGPLTFPSSSDQTSSNNGKWILVDISEQHMYVYEKDQIIFSFIASTGMNSSTRVGSFAVQSKIPNAYGATWDIWMPDWLGIYYSGSLENGIHALPILQNGATLWDGFLGTPISYGCVVLGSYDAEILYKWAEIGVPVIIQP